MGEGMNVVLIGVYRSYADTRRYLATWRSFRIDPHEKKGDG
jgi:hypothetical protein